jgi:hypothetical protein
MSAGSDMLRAVKRVIGRGGPVNGNRRKPCSLIKNFNAFRKEDSDAIEQGLVFSPLGPFSGK